MAQIIAGSDLNDVPGVKGTTEELAYAARRASSEVESAWCSPVEPAPQWVKDIATDVAARYLANPRGVSSVTRRVDDAGRTERFGENDPAATGPAGFVLTDAEKRRLCPKTRRQAGTIFTRVPGYR